MKRGAVLLILMFSLILFALFTNPGAEFGGADGQAEDVIAQLDPGYEAWFHPVWEPPSGEIESLLFALQAALGTGFICFYLGYQIGRTKGRVE